MASRKKRPHKGHLRLVGGRPPGGTAIGVARIEALLPDYVTWVLKQGGTREAAVAAWHLVADVARMHADAAPFQAPDELDPGLVRQILLAGEDPDLVDDMATSLDAYLHFFDETGRWTRGRDTWEAFHDLVTPDDDEIDVPELTAEEALSAWKDVPLIGSLLGLLRWIGPARDVTQSGLLRLKDIEPAAAARGSSSGASATRSGRSPTPPASRSAARRRSRSSFRRWPIPPLLERA
ncbi:hypothetical protein ACQ7DA_10860 [Zafaria sp. J156]|uniref:hypothetical protein n=1 Tax=Zafaria sp. J156 TaxID=3116490 RepID=UPI002E78E857|nr:hypothetical protein [Zafaria sp. J156]MEE1621679.1 hypothetical protein [Zafaria sp. J156]